MKRSHRRVHFGIWVIIGPLMLWLLVLAFADIPETPDNDVLPEALTEEAS
ncbi:MAG: hypothetical protein HRT82_06550 [Henriciella sp.]|nr:hypothetical protein [Henriciella sp.]